MEPEFGITEYLSGNVGFECIFKQRFQDFIVHEVDNEGTVVRLTDQSAPNIHTPNPPPVEEKLYKIVAETELNQLKELAAATGDLKEVLIPCQGLTKAERTEIHQSIRSEFCNTLQSFTESRENGQFIVVKQAKNDPQSRKRKHWPLDRGDFCQFTMFKINKDTQFALAVVARYLGLRANDLDISGTKDRRAITTQRVSVYRIEAQRLAKMNDKLNGIQLGNFCYKTSALGLGDLKGNVFTIVLRNVQSTRESIDPLIESLKTKGFINYFGSQRFGTSTVGTHEVGIALLKRNYKEAVDLILSVRDDAEDLTECLQIWKDTRDPAKALAAVKSSIKHTRIETTLLHGLKKQKNNYANALKELSRNTRNLYVHSYQSLIWNQIVSRRISKLGVEPMLGDVVMDKDGQPKTLSETELSQFTSFDVVLPLPSSQMTLPNNDTGAWYQELLDADGLTLDDFAHCAKDFSLHGSCRQILILPKDLSAEYVQYSDATVPLTLSDLEVMQGVELEPSTGDLLALKLEFELPAGCYATMAIREITKVDMGKKHQRTLNEAGDTVEEKPPPPACTSIQSALLSSPIGPLTLQLCTSGIHSLQMCPSVTDSTFSPCPTTPVHLTSGQSSPQLTSTLTWLTNYFTHKTCNPLPPICILSAHKPTFRMACLKQLATIPFGQTMTYGSVASACGSPAAARAVGQAMKLNPVMIMLPCHRVMGAEGKIGGFCGTSRVDVKKWLLGFERE